MPKSEKSWEKRLNGSIDELAVDFVESLSFDRRLYKYDIVGSIAHAEMLAQQKLISKAECAEIKKALVEISEEIAAGKFAFNKVHEDIHMAIEDALIHRIGDAGKKLHTGRSRNDQVAMDLRLWMRDEIELIQARLVSLQKALLRLAQRYAEDIMPAYTHLQRAQPVTIGAYILSFVEMFARDIRRLGHCRELLNVSPLGSGAVAGSTLPLDRQATARQLGFVDITYNSIDSVADRDFCAEFLFDCAMIATHLSRLAEDWILFCSTEYSFLTIDDKYCTSSSMMPQKRNPDMLELIRGKTGRVYGALVGMLTVLKAQPSTYNRDLQEDKIHVFSAADTIGACLDMTAAIASGCSFNTRQIAAGMDRGFLDATALAEYLVKKGIPFRQAHGIVGALVAECETGGKRLSDLDLERFRAACGAIDEDVYQTLNALHVTQQYQTEGAAGPLQTHKQIEYWKNFLHEH
jgi:argininosuccinate lyase